MIEGDAYALPPADLPIHIIIRDAQGTALVDRAYALNENGTLDGALVLADTASTGYYSLEARRGDG